MLHQRFFRYHEHLYNTALQEKKARSVVHAIPYCSVFRKCFAQCFNVFFTYFVTLAIFPAVHAGRGRKEYKNVHFLFFRKTSALRTFAGAGFESGRPLHIKTTYVRGFNTLRCGGRLFQSFKSFFALNS